MAHAHHHAVSSASRFGGVLYDYIAIHAWFDQTKAHVADARHRMLLHHSFGIFLCEQQFGMTITNSDGKVIPVRLIAEQHIREDFGFIPSVEQCLEHLPLEDWMSNGAAALSRDPVTRRLKPRRGTTPESHSESEASA